jgi:hypothetical protein
LNARAGIAGFEKSMDEENVQKLLPLMGNGFGLSVKKTKSKGTPSLSVKVNGAVAPGFTMMVSLPDAGSVRLDAVYSSGIAEAVGRIARRMEAATQALMESNFEGFMGERFPAASMRHAMDVCG